MPGVTDYDYAKSPCGKFSRGLVDSLDEGAGRIDNADSTRLRHLPYLRRDAMRRKKHRLAVRNLGETFDEGESALLQFFDNDFVVDKLVKAVEGSA